MAKKGRAVRVAPGLRRGVVLVTIALLSVGLPGCLSSESSSVSNVHTVVPGVLIRGGQPDERGLRTLRDTYRVKTVVNFNDQTNKSEAKAVERLGLNYLPLRDDPFRVEGDRELILSFLKVVRDAGQNGVVYVHCKTGSDRVGVVIATYRIVECGWDADRALAELRRYQDIFHAAVFYGIPSFLREVEQHRAEWLDALDKMPDPPVQRAELSGTSRRIGAGCEREDR